MIDLVFLFLLYIFHLIGFLCMKASLLSTDSFETDLIDGHWSKAEEYNISFQVRKIVTQSNIEYKKELGESVQKEVRFMKISWKKPEEMMSLKSLLVFTAMKLYRRLCCLSVTTILSTKIWLGLLWLINIILFFVTFWCFFIVREKKQHSFLFFSVR